jgi:isopenicillin-N epimerase
MWSLSPDLHHLNHGSFGAVPVPVQEKRLEWLRRWEAAPTAWVYEEMQPALEEARTALAGFLGAEREGLAFIRNATTGAASVLRSVELRGGDEVVVTNHAYNAVRQSLEYEAGRVGARIVTVDIRFPLESPEQVSDAVIGAVGPATRLVVVDHIASPTGVVFPIDDMVARLEPEVPVLVDGAHGPGQVPLDLDRLGASWYVGNLHKWVCAPRGAGFLSTRVDWTDRTFPVVISHGWNSSIAGGGSRYHALFDWLGTDDMTPWLTVPEALRVVGDLHPDGWDGLMARNRALALEARSVLCDAMGVAPLTPESMVGAMATVPIPDGVGEAPTSFTPPLYGDLRRAGFDTVVSVWPEWPRQLLRVSAHAYNTIDEYEKLAAYLVEG